MPVPLSGGKERWLLNCTAAMIVPSFKDAPLDRLNKDTHWEGLGPGTTSLALCVSGGSGRGLDLGTESLTDLGTESPMTLEMEARMDSRMESLTYLQLKSVSGLESELDSTSDSASGSVSAAESDWLTGSCMNSRTGSGM